MSTWWLMVSGRDTIWQGLSTCVNPTCVTCSMSVSVSTCQTGSRTSDPPSHLNFNLRLTKLSSPRRKTGTQLYLDTEIMETLGLVCLDIYRSVRFSLRILKFQYYHVQSCVWELNQLSPFVYSCSNKWNVEDKIWSVLIKHETFNDRERPKVGYTCRISYWVWSMQNYSAQTEIPAFCAAPFCSIFTLKSILVCTF